MGRSNNLLANDFDNLTKQFIGASSEEMQLWQIILGLFGTSDFCNRVATKS